MNCGGNGKLNCPRCEGHGTIWVTAGGASTTTCPTCVGRKVIGQRCGGCPACERRKAAADKQGRLFG